MATERVWFFLGRNDWGHMTGISLLNPLDIKWWAPMMTLGLFIHTCVSLFWPCRCSSYKSDQRPSFVSQLCIFHGSQTKSEILDSSHLSTDSSRTWSRRAAGWHLLLFLTHKRAMGPGSFLLVTEYFYILMAVVVTGIYTWGKVHTHAHTNTHVQTGEI